MNLTTTSRVVGTRIKNGRVLTARRQRMVMDYKQRRWRILSNNPRLSVRDWNAAVAWFEGFEDFMCWGLDDDDNASKLDAQNAESKLHHQPHDARSQDDRS